MHPFANILAPCQALSPPISAFYGWYVGNWCRRELLEWLSWYRAMELICLTDVTTNGSSIAHSCARLHPGRWRGRSRPRIGHSAARRRVPSGRAILRPAFPAPLVPALIPTCTRIHQGTGSILCSPLGGTTQPHNRMVSKGLGSTKVGKKKTAIRLVSIGIVRPITVACCVQFWTNGLKRHDVGQNRQESSLSHHFPYQWPKA